MTSPSSSFDGSIKKTVSFPENVVSEVIDYEKNDKALNGLLFYSQDDYRRFKMERRQSAAKSQRMANSRSRSRRRGVMYSYDTYIPRSTEFRARRLHRMLGMTEPLQPAGAQGMVM